ncbi:cytochrome ubiquinol oxidase subunit I [Ketobacter sp. MCCC 1A13808]|uniref:cytochrome ubiquinol oxidase subunit I n=1 Tax=Ketobacter sp. MCCC 1A13808 TaxID=2602738 RepID=UPI0012EB970A|nr:cytochrome ubiquinol oxidase subunit I [Ketobacter sp. MCCC 1A13808]MVF14976.1 cytochrome ubiquinol oxidase subunit I [Ketobacter sp. MCCC 1A13808]
MDVDYILISRLGFAFTASYHIIFPSLIVGLAFYLTALEALWLKTGQENYRLQYLFWLKPFTAAFFVAVITGVGLSFQLDTHFGQFYYKTIDILAPIRHFELINAIVLEAGSLGVMWWGWKRVGKKLHFAATLMMSLGIIISFVCIIARNSWMQTPDGYELVAGQLVLTDWFAAIINPSFPYRFTHMLLAGLMSTACFVLGLSAWFLIKQQQINFARFNLHVALTAIVILAPLQIFIGDLHGLNTRENQPMKIAAIEGLWKTTDGAPLVLFGIPDKEKAENKNAIEIPKLASLILTHKTDGEVKGMNAFPKQNWPNVALIFYSFRIMVALGFWIVLIGFIGCYLRYKNKLNNNKIFLRIAIFTIPAGFIATIAGWLVAEAGRQPWVIYEIIKTKDILLPISRTEAIHSLLLMGIIYGLTLIGFLYAMFRILTKNPENQYEKKLI